MKRKNMNRIIKFASDLIGIDTTQKNESLVVDYIESCLLPLGFLSKRVPINRESLKNHSAYTKGNYLYTGRESGVFVLKGKKNDGRRLLFNAHSDVVPAGNLKVWNLPPFEAREAEGKLFGRGAADTKGGLAALLTAVTELFDDGWRPDYELIIEIVSDEEGGGNGTLACMLAGEKADAVVFIEPGGVENLFIGHRGGLKFSLTTVSEGTSLENRGTKGAIDAMTVAIDAVREFAKEHAMTPPHPDYTAYDNPRPLYLGKIDSGSWFSSPATQCCLEGVIGWLPGDKEEVVKERFESGIKKRFAEEGLRPPIIKFSQHHIKPCKTDCTERIVNVVKQAIKTVLNQDAIISCANFGTDMWIRRIYEKTSCVIFGPGGGNCHMPNEFVWIKELEKSKLIFQKILQSW